MNLYPSDKKKSGLAPLKIGSNPVDIFVDVGILRVRRIHCLQKIGEPPLTLSGVRLTALRVNLNVKAVEVRRVAVRVTPSVRVIVNIVLTSLMVGRSRAARPRLKSLPQL